MDQSLDSLMLLEDVAFRSARRAQNKAASGSLRSFQEWISSSAGAVHKSIKDPEPEQDKLRVDGGP